MRIVSESGCWPTPKQELLVKACLLRGEAAIQAFEQWNTPGSLDETDHASFRLLPLLYHNLLRHGYQHPAMQRLKGVHRRAWFENQQLFRHFAPALEILQKAGIPVILLKGAALVRLYYADDGLRPMSDVDLLVPTERAMEALGLLRAAGWRPDPPAYEPRRESHLRFRHALCLRGPNQAEIDLHWHDVSGALAGGGRGVLGSGRAVRLQRVFGAGIMSGGSTADCVPARSNVG